MSTPWVHEAEFSRLMRQCCDGHGVSQSEFDRLVQMSRDIPPEAMARITGLVQLMAEEFLGWIANA